MTQQIQLNPALDPDALRESFLERGRLQIPNIFDQATADYLHQLLKEHQDWYLAYNEGDQFFESSMAELQSMTPKQQQRFNQGVSERARDQFQYVFFQYYITQAIRLGEHPGHPMHAMHAFMNSEASIDFMRRLTGQDDINQADSFASCYLPGHFLTRHDDRHAAHDRVAAYVFSLTTGWDPNWGGHLAFFDPDGNIEQALMPSFNSLNLFLVPQDHSVQQVTSFAGVSRTSYIGWLQR